MLQHVELSCRYLCSFHPKSLPHFFTDVLVIGGGVAGLRAALAIERDVQVLVVTKDSLAQSNSVYAQGGIAGVLDPEDRFESHIDDTLEAGKGLCDREVVEMVVREAPARIRELIEWGTRFDLEDGQLALAQEGGHSRARVVHALGDATGREMMRAVTERAQAAENVEIWENTFTIDLLTDGGACRGALVWQAGRGKMLVWAKQTILATGGTGQLYRESTNPEVATGDGHALAFRAGAEVRDMEFMQFHPTVLYIAGSGRSLITEAMRGEGAYLCDRHGARFMAEYDPRGELAPRDVVSRAITEQMARTQHPCVYLDLTHLDPERAVARFPRIARVCGDFGLDITRDLIPVRPGAHYMIGGMSVDREGRSTLPRLWGAGEVTSSGLHGANRLGSNSLLEGLVYGVLCGRGASESARRMADRFEAESIVSRREMVRQDALNVSDIRNSLRSLMVRSVGIERDRAGLEEARENVEFWQRYVLEREFNGPEGWQLQNMLLVARLMITAALLREETRGVHMRRDFPEMDDGYWRQHIELRSGG